MSRLAASLGGVLLWAVPCVAQYQLNVDRIPAGVNLGPSVLTAPDSLSEAHNLGFNLGVFGGIPIAGPLAIRWSGAFDRFYYSGDQAVLGPTQQLNLWHFGVGPQLQTGGRTRIHCFLLASVFKPTLGTDEDPEQLNYKTQVGVSFGGGFTHMLSPAFSIGAEVQANRVPLHPGLLGSGGVLWALSPSVNIARHF